MQKIKTKLIINSNNSMKFVIGTAQIKKGYGILGNHLRLSEAKKILVEKRKNIDFVDTAPSYGISEKYLGKNLNKNIKIITKIDKLKSKEKKEVSKEIEEKIIKSFKKFKRTIYCVLFHNQEDAKWLKEKIIRSKFKELIKDNYIKKIGVSCYQYKDIEYYCKIFKFDVFQIPLNVLNIKKDKIDNLKKLKRRYGFEVHARSVFLQGVLLMQSYELPKKLRSIKKKLDQIKIFIEKKKIKKTDFLISIIDNLNLVKCIIIGFKKFNEFEEILNYKKIKLDSKDIYRYRIRKETVIDPRYW
jgi:aryl-alcohol dehydrogenase-like predicted oxidoreductase